jgi:hypothetical protein
VDSIAYVFEVELARGDKGSVYLAYGLLVFSVAFFGGMSALVILRSRQEARKLQAKNVHVGPETKQRRNLD